MRRLGYISILLISLLMVAYTTQLYGATTQTSSISVTVPTILVLNITNADQSITVSESDVTTGYKDLTAANPTLAVAANKAWNLSIKSSGFGIVGSYTKPIGELLFKHTHGYVQNGFDSFKALTDSDQVIAGKAGPGGASIQGQYQIALSENDIEGEYVATVTFTLTAQA